MNRWLTTVVFLACAFLPVRGAAQVSVPGADAIALGGYFEAFVSGGDWGAPNDFSPRIELLGGKLPYGLSITRDGRVAGYPAAVERTTARLRATAVDGRMAEGDVAFAVADPAFRLIYKDLPAVKLGQSATFPIQGQGGTAPYGGCALTLARTFSADAAVPGEPAPAVDAAPAWLTISDDCTLTAAAPDKEAEVLLVITARDAAGATAEEFYAVRATADPSAPGWLQAKARQYNKDYQDKFSPTGLTHELGYDGAYTGYGDTAIWTGTYCGGAAYYYAVTGEDYARANVDKCLKGVTDLRLVTGVFWGNAIIWDLINDPDFQARAADNITAMAAHIWDNNMHIMDVDGKHTRHGVMSGYGIQDSEGEKNYDPYENPAVKVPNGMNSAMLLNWFNMAATVAPDPAARELWRTRVKGLAGKCPNSEPGREFECSYLSNLKKLYVYGEAYNDYYETAWFNLNLLFNNYFHLVRFEPNDKLRDKYREAFRFLWEDKKPLADGCEAPTARRAGRERNPHFTWQFLAAQGDREPRRIFNAVSELMAFPHGPRTQFQPANPASIRAEPDHPDWACEPIPVQLRVTSDFQWQRSPYTIGSTWPTGDCYYPGVDMITPYWMGRYFGYIPETL